jgi:hypothetical protein
MPPNDENATHGTGCDDTGEQLSPWDGRYLLERVRSVAQRIVERVRKVIEATKPAAEVPSVKEERGLADV